MSRSTRRQLFRLEPDPADALWDAELARIALRREFEECSSAKGDHLLRAS